MTASTSLETVRKLVTGWDGSATCLYLPRPVVEGGDEKWRILKKNALAQLAALESPTDAVADALRDWRLGDFRGRGVALIQRDGALMTAHLNSRPDALLWEDDQPFVLPLLADLDLDEPRWVLALDRSQARLFLYANGELEELSDRFDAPEYRGVEAARSIQDDIFFHSSGAKRSGRDSGPPMFHALGSDQSREREKTDEAYYREVIEALIDVIPVQVGTIDLFGDPATAGHFAALLKTKGLEARVRQMAGDALTPERLITALTDEADDRTPLQADETAAPRVEAALAEGRVETLYCAADLCGQIDGRGNENMDIRDAKEEPEASRLNALALAALRSGAEVRVAGRQRMPEGAAQAARFRW